MHTPSNKVLPSYPCRVSFKTFLFLHFFPQSPWQTKLHIYLYTTGDKSGSILQHNKTAALWNTPNTSQTWPEITSVWLWILLSTHISLQNSAGKCQNLFHSVKLSPKLLKCQWVIHQWKSFQHKSSDTFSLVTYFHLDSLTISDWGIMFSHNGLREEDKGLSGLLWKLCVHLSGDWGYRFVEGLSWGEDVLVV